MQVCEGSAVCSCRLIEHDFAALIFFIRYLASNDARANPDPEVVHALSLTSASGATSGLNSGLCSESAFRPLEGPPQAPIPIHTSTGMIQMAQRTFPSESPLATDIGVATRWLRSDMQTLRPASEGLAPLRGHEGVLWENQRRISDIGSKMPHWGAEIAENAWSCDTRPHDDPSAGLMMRDPAALSGRHEVVYDAGPTSAPTQGRHLRKRHHQQPSTPVLPELGGVIDHNLCVVDDNDGITDSNAQLTLRTSMAELMIKQLTEKVSFIEKVSTNE